MKWVNKVNFTRFSTQNLFQIGACVISARRARHLDVTTHVYILSCKHVSRPIRARVVAYYLSYFINRYKKRKLNLVKPPVWKRLGAGVGWVAKTVCTSEH